MSSIAELRLDHFRNFASLVLPIHSQIVVFYGDNGSGKTNLLEALSLFSQGRGLRRVDAKTLVSQGNFEGYSVFVRLSDDVALASGLRFEEGTWQKKFRIDETATKSAADFSNYIRPIWLIPAMDGLFMAAPSERRKYLDRMVLTIDPAHGGRVQAFERAIASRNKLLSEPSYDSVWVRGLEKDIAERGVAIVAARHDLLERLKDVIAKRESGAFPQAELALEGDIDELFRITSSCLELEDIYIQNLSTGRGLDKASGRTHFGPQTSDLKVVHKPKAMPAALCSTGEQKALLIGLTLAHAQLVGALSTASPLLLLDEVAAHLDLDKRKALFDELQFLGFQSFMTGTDKLLFDGLGERAQMCEVKAGCIL